DASPSAPSTSTITRPLVAPVGRPIFASGQALQNRPIWPGSVVAALSPLYGRGCLPVLVPHPLSPQLHDPSDSGLCNGNMAKPCSAYASAASPMLSLRDSGVASPVALAVSLPPRIDVPSARAGSRSPS